MPETEQNVNLNPKKFRVPKFLKNRYVIFGLSLFLFLFGAIVLILLDEMNTYRPKFMDGLYEWLKTLGLTFDVSMATWVMFFVMFGLFFAFFFILIFYKSGLVKRQNKSLAKRDRELTGGEKARYRIFFFAIVIVVLGAAMAGAFIFLNKTGYIEVVTRQFGDLGHQMINFLIALGLLLGFILMVPLSFFVLILLFEFFIKMVSLIVGGVSNSVMQSEGYQKNAAAAQAAAKDIERAMREAREHAGEAVRAAAEAMAGGGAKGNSNAQSPQADIVFPALTTIDVKWAEKEEAERKAQEAAEKKAKEEAEKKAKTIYLGDNVTYNVGGRGYCCEGCISDSLIKTFKNAKGYKVTHADHDRIDFMYITNLSGKYNESKYKGSGLTSKLTAAGAEECGGLGGGEPEPLTKSICKEYNLLCE